MSMEDPPGRWLPPMSMASMSRNSTSDLTGARLETVREVMPSMLTLDRRVIQQDCLCYLMDRIHFEDHIEVTDHDPLPEGLRRSDRPGEPAL